MVKYNYYGHSCFSLSVGEKVILVDPFFSENPMTKVDPDSID